MVKKTKPKSEHGYYCDLCGEKICKYWMDWNNTGAINILRAIVVRAGKHKEIDHKEFEVCYSCCKEIAEGVVDAF